MIEIFFLIQAFFWNKLTAKFSSSIIFVPFFYKSIGIFFNFSTNQKNVIRVAILTNNSTKNHETLLSIWWYILFWHVREEGWKRRGGKGEGSCGEIFLYSCLLEYHSLVPKCNAFLSFV